LRSSGTLRRFFQTGYQAKSWSWQRKVIARVEATSKGADVRFVVTNLPDRAKVLYERGYCARGIGITNGRGRETGYPAPPAQIPACAANAPGSSLGSNVGR
jgi:hypothetical protein